ncbi:MAG TPA: toll/interleukin-1 receptor domain-containing protein [Pyrinomonadaceae bacterium]|jgi:hypothetical protein
MNIEQALALIAKLLRSQSLKSQRIDDPRAEAIGKVWKAVDETRIYLRQWETPEVYNKPNRKLVKLWSEAALAIAVFDNKLANRLRRKAEHWSAPEHWSDKAVEKAGIRIDKIAEDARSLLNFSQSTQSQSVSQPVATREEDKFDVFISHASEDKEVIASPLAFELARRTYKVWYDRFQLKLGDKLRQEIDKGLLSCRYGVVILSHNFFSKAWTKRELDSLVALEDSDGRKRILPILHNMNQNEVAGYSPTIADRITASSNQGIDRLADEIAEVLQN